MRIEYTILCFANLGFLFTKIMFVEVSPKNWLLFSLS